jgi:hypothetical protein
MDSSGTLRVFVVTKSPMLVSPLCECWKLAVPMRSPSDSLLLNARVYMSRIDALNLALHSTCENSYFWYRAWSVDRHLEKAGSVIKA